MGLLVAFLFVWGLAALAAGFALRALPRVWRGERVPGLRRRWAGFPEINHRNHPAYTLFVTSFTVWLGALGLAELVWGIPDQPVFRTAMAVRGMRFILVGSVTVSLGSLAAIVTITFLGRPRFLVPPPHRRHPGALAPWRARRRGRRGEAGW